MTQPQQTNVESIATLDIARSHAWEWFKFHASQRLIVFNFFLIMTAATIAGFVTTFAGKHYAISAALSILQFIIVLAFYNLDRRNSSLVKLAEAYLRREEDRLFHLLDEPSIKFVELSEQVKPRHSLNSFRTILTVIFSTVGVISFFLFCISLLFGISATG